MPPAIVGHVECRFTNRSGNIGPRLPGGRPDVGAGGPIHRVRPGAVRRARPPRWRQRQPMESGKTTRRPSGTPACRSHLHRTCVAAPALRRRAAPSVRSAVRRKCAEQVQVKRQAEKRMSVETDSPTGLALGRTRPGTHDIRASTSVDMSFSAAHFNVRRAFGTKPSSKGHLNVRRAWWTDDRPAFTAAAVCRLTLPDRFVKLHQT